MGPAYAGYGQPGVTQLATVQPTTTASNDNRYNLAARTVPSTLPLVPPVVPLTYLPNQHYAPQYARTILYPVF